MLQGMLADHAKLVLHTETKNLPTYILTVGDGGSKLQPAKNAAETINLEGNAGTVERQVKIDDEGRARAEHQMFLQSTGDKAMGISAGGVSMKEIVRQFSMQLGMNVVDKTGLQGTYDYTLHWSESPDSENPSFLTAVQEQLGLKLERVKAPTQVLVIDHIERPEEVANDSR
jgi:uncharacterized protein (TIGR03435 family)